MTTEIERATLFKKLHSKGDPLVLFNIWDAGSARAMQKVGAKAIATGSWSVAAAHGYDDGEKLPSHLVLANIQRIVASVDIPVTIDLEGGYGQSPLEVQENAIKIMESGAVGINFEDQIIGGGGLYSIKDQCARIKAIRDASTALFINARTDIFLKAGAPTHSDVHVKEAIDRAVAYAEAGASGFFVPGLRDAKYIKKLSDCSPIPVNIMVMADTPLPKQLAELGVARISYGPGPYLQVIEYLKEVGRNALLTS